MVVNAYFSKFIFVNNSLDMGFHTINRLRDDAYFRYPTTKQPAGNKGQPKLYDGKINIKHLKKERFKTIQLEEGQGRILPPIVSSYSLK